MYSPEVHNNLLHLLHIQMEIVVLAPRSQPAHLTPVDRLIAVVDETHHSRVVRKLDKEVGAGCWCAVVGQQSEEEGAKHTSWGAPVFSVMVLEVLLPTQTACGLPVRKSSSQLHREVLSPSWSSL